MLLKANDADGVDDVEIKWTKADWRRHLYMYLRMASEEPSLVLIYSLHHQVQRNLPLSVLWNIVAPLTKGRRLLEAWLIDSQRPIADCKMNSLLGKSR